MASPYIKERLDTFEYFAKDRDGFAGGEPWTLEPRGLRFRHGESLKELRLPYHLGGQDEEIIERAIGSAASLLKARYSLDAGDGAGASGFFSSAHTEEAKIVKADTIRNVPICLNNDLFFIGSMISFHFYR